MPRHILYNTRVGALQHERLGYRSDKTIFVPNGFNTEAFRPLSSEERKAMRSDLGLDPDRPLIGVVARSHPMKDHHTFIRAAALAASKNPDLRFLLVGGYWDGEEVPVLRWIPGTWIGILVHTSRKKETDVSKWISVLDIAVSSSAYDEGFPNVIGEAMASAVPCVVTDVGDTAWVLGEAGFTVPPKNPQRMAEAMLQLIQLGEDGRRALGILGRQRVCEYFSISTVMQRFKDIYGNSTKDV